jgi:beta-glucosidase
VALLVAALEPEEKWQIMSSRSPAIQRLNVSALTWNTECLHGLWADGVVGYPSATVLPQPVAMAATFDAGLVEQVADAITTEGRALYNNGSTQFLSCFAPSISIVRTPNWGRQSEVWGEDPSLTGSMGAAFIRGVQGNDTHYLKAVSILKHAFAYSLELVDGVTRFAFDAVVNRYDWTNTYLAAWKTAMDARPAAAMCAYVSVNGTPACNSAFVLNETLRSALGFDGFVTSDGEAIRFNWQSHRFAPTLEGVVGPAVAAGCDMNSGVSYINAGPSAQAQGLVTQAQVDTAVARILRARFRLGEFDPPRMVPWSGIPLSVIGSEKHLRLARTVGQRSVVLLKHDGKTLPLRNGTRIALSGGPADDQAVTLGCYYTQPAGGNVVTVFQALQGAGMNVSFTSAIPAVTGVAAYGLERAFMDAQHPWTDVAVVVIGTSSVRPNSSVVGLDAVGTEREMQDRTSIDVPGQQMHLVKAIAMRSAVPIVLVVMSGGSVDLSWAHQSPRVASIVECWYPGQIGAQGLADVLTGVVAPTGRLPLTFYFSNYTQIALSPLSMDMRAYPGRTHRYVQVPVLYEFGYGLSMTQWRYTDLAVDPEANTASMTVTNLGSTTSGETVLLFAAPTQLVDGDPHRVFIGSASAPIVRPGESVSLASILLVPDAFLQLTRDDGTAPIRWRVWAGAASGAVSPGRQGASINLVVPAGSARFDASP